MWTTLFITTDKAKQVVKKKRSKSFNVTQIEVVNKSGIGEKERNAEQPKYTAQNRTHTKQNIPTLINNNTTTSSHSLTVLLFSFSNQISNAYQRRIYSASGHRKNRSLHCFHDAAFNP